MYKGIVWVVDEEDPASSERCLVKIKTDSQGTILEHDLPLNSKKRKQLCEQADLVCSSKRADQKESF